MRRTFKKRIKKLSSSSFSPPSFPLSLACLSLLFHFLFPLSSLTINDDVAADVESLLVGVSLP